MDAAPATAPAGTDPAAAAAAGDADAPPAPKRPTTEVERLLARVGGEFPPAVAREANQLLRKLAVKMKPGSLGKHEVCRPAVAVELACRVCHHHAYPRAALVAQSMVKEAVYKDVLRRAEQALDLRASYTPRQLAVILGGEPAADLAERLLRAYEPRYRDSLHESRRGGAAGAGPQQPLQEQPALVATAFFLATKKLKIKVDRKRLQEVAGVQTGELNNVINSMQDLCTDLLGGGAMGGGAGAGGGGGGGRRLSVASRKRPLDSSGGLDADRVDAFGLSSSQDLGSGARFSLSSDAGSQQAKRGVRQSPRGQQPQPHSQPQSQSQQKQRQQQENNNPLSNVGGGGKDPRSQQHPSPPGHPRQQAPPPQQRRGGGGQEEEEEEEEEDGPRLLRFKTEEERALYEGWKRAVLEASAAKQQKRRRSSAAAGGAGGKKKKAKMAAASAAATSASSQASQASAASSSSTVAASAPAPAPAASASAPAVEAN